MAKKRVLLGRIAIRKGWITRQQLFECLQIQQNEAAKRGGKAPPLGAILLKKGYIDDDMLMELMELQREIENEGG